MLGISARLNLTDDETTLIASYANDFGCTARTAYQRVKNGIWARKDLRRLIKEHGSFTSYQADSIINRVDQWITTDEELLKCRIEQLEQKQAVDQKKLVGLDSWLTQHEQNKTLVGQTAFGTPSLPATGLSTPPSGQPTHPRFSSPSHLTKISTEIDRKRKLRFTTNRRLKNRTVLLDSLKENLRTGTISRVFGGKKLLRQRHQLDEKTSPWKDQQAWEAEWYRKRSGEIFSMGAGAKPFGNQCAGLDPINKTLTLRLTEKQTDERIAAEAARLGILPEMVPNRNKYSRLVLSDMVLEPVGAERLALAQSLGIPVTVQIQNKLTPKAKRIQSKTNKRLLTRKGRRREAVRRKKLVSSPSSNLKENQNPSAEAAWYVHASFDLPAIPVITSRARGVLGVDFNAWGLAWVITTPDGNILTRPFENEFDTEAENRSDHDAALDRSDGKSIPDIHATTDSPKEKPKRPVPLPSCTSRQLKGNIPLALRHLSSEQAREVVRHAVQSLVALAERYQVAIAIEDLDFAKKKADMGDQGARYNRMLSSLNTAGFADALRSRCHKKGIPLHKVNPAWTSIAGWAKYGMKNALSIDQAAAFAIARKALLGSINDKPLPTHIQTGPKAGQKLSPKFVRALRVKREAQVVSYHESVCFAQPSPAFHKMMLRSHKECSWSNVSKVLGANRKYWKRPWSFRVADLHSKAVADPVVGFQRPPERRHRTSLGSSLTTREMSNASPSSQVTAVLG